MNTHSSSLSPTQQRVLAAVRTHTQLTTSQVRRLLYVGTVDGTRIRSQRHLKRLYELGLIRRVWSVYDIRPAEYLYMPAGSTTRGAVQHTLDISELYVRLCERAGAVAFDREPWCHKRVGGVNLKPDAYLTFGVGRDCFIEVDRGPERKPQLTAKLGNYVRAFQGYDEELDGEEFPHFPQVIWTVQDAERRRVLRQLIKQTRLPGLFSVLLFDEAVDQITKG